MSDHASDSAPQTSARPNVFAGHLGHLTKEQEDALTKFKEILASSNLYTPASAASPASHDDPTLLYVYLFTQCQAGTECPAAWVCRFYIVADCVSTYPQPLPSSTYLPTTTSSKAICCCRSVAKGPRRRSAVCHI